MAATQPLTQTVALPRVADTEQAARRDGTSLFSAREAFAPLSMACALGSVLILILARDLAVAYAAAGAFAIASLVSILLATSWGRGESVAATRRRTLAVAALGASAAFPGWFFGPSSAYAGVLAILVLFSGLLMGGVRTPFSSRAAWSVYVAIASSQALVATLVFAGVIRDASLLPLLPPDATPWHHVACHLVVQGVFAAAFGIGRALHHRYWAIAEELEVAIRSTARRDALLDEARAEYRRTFARRGARVESAAEAPNEARVDRAAARNLVIDACDALDAAHRTSRAHGGLATSQRHADVVELRTSLANSIGCDLDVHATSANKLCAQVLALLDDDTESVSLQQTAPMRPAVRSQAVAGRPTSHPSLELVRAPSPSIADVASSAWHGAFADKMRLQYVAMFVACVVGAVLIGLVVNDTLMRIIAWSSIGAAATIIAAERRRAREWPWAIIGALAIGPAYVLGLHSGFAAVLAVTLFVESSFRSREQGITGRGWTLAAVLLTQAAAFALITMRVIPDGHVTTVLHHTPWWSAVVIQSLVMGTYVTAFVIGHIVYTRYTELVERNEVAARGLAAKEALLATARAEIESVLKGYEGGLFAGSKIGPYHVDSLIGRGGMGEVYAASRGSERVALKVIRPDRIASESVLARFGGEAETLRLVDSEYVARVLDVGTEDGLPYFTMELVEGESLGDTLRQLDRVSLDEARAIVRDVTRGLADCHRVGVIHRDVKPHNLVLTDSDRRWKLVDFGIAKLAQMSASSAFVVGTPAYMAPEQLRGEEVDERADLYSLCLVLYRVLAGRPAFAYTGPTRPLPSDPYQIRNLPADLRDVLRIGLASAPEDRFASALELQCAFEAAFEGRLEQTLRRRAERLASDFL